MIDDVAPADHERRLVQKDAVRMRCLLAISRRNSAALIEAAMLVYRSALSGLAVGSLVCDTHSEETAHFALGLSPTSPRLSPHSGNEEGRGTLLNVVFFRNGKSWIELQPMYSLKKMAGQPISRKVME